MDDYKHRHPFTPAQIGVLLFLGLVLLILDQCGIHLFGGTEASGREPETRDYSGLTGDLPPAADPVGPPSHSGAPSSRCGSPNAEIDPMPANWALWSCQEYGEALPSDTRCLGREAYASQAGMGCPGAQRCCPPPAPGASPLSVGDAVTAEWRQGMWYPGHISRVHSDGTVTVRWDDGTTPMRLPRDQVRGR